MKIEDKITILDLENMDLHDSIMVKSKVEKIGDYLITITRVPNGWIYTSMEGIGKNITSTFVPFKVNNK